MRARNSGAAILASALSLALAGSIEPAFAQPSQGPPPVRAPSSPPLQPAGVIPSSVSLSVTGSPAGGSLLDTQIRNALDRQIRPTLRPGASIHYGAFVPWPLLPLAPGDRAAVNVSVSISGNNDSIWASGVTTVNITNVVVAPATPSILFFSDDPEYLPTEGLVFHGRVDAGRPARLYYYHDDIGLPRDLDVVLTAAATTRLQVIQSGAGPDLDVMSVGHTVSRSFLLFEQQNEGAIVDVPSGTPVILRHDLILQGEVVAGAIDLHVLAGGPATVSIVASPAGGSPEPYLNGPRLPFDGHNRHGTFDLSGYGVIGAAYTVGGPDALVKYGGTIPTPRNIDPGDPGRDYGDYGVVHRITFKLINPTDVPHPVYLYEKPLGGPVRSSFLVDGQLKELGCARLREPYWFMTYELAPHSTGASTTLTMTDGGSFYPLEFGVTETQPHPYTPPINAPDGCATNATPTPSPSAAPQPLIPSPTPSDEGHPRAGAVPPGTRPRQQR